MEPFLFGVDVERFAFFVDAGYLYAAGGELCCGTKRRDQIEVAFPSLLAALTATGERYASAEHLRTYWYDAAPEGLPTRSQQAVAYQRGVKLRLGRLTMSGQKGVDSLIVRDLMKLSGEHAITTAFLLSGDEDLRQGMIEAQDAGVKVVLVGIQPFSSQNQAGSLIREADDIIMLDRAFLVPHIQSRPDRGAPQPSGDRGQTLKGAPGDAAAGVPDPLTLGLSVGAAWAERATSDEVQTLARRKHGDPRTAIPSEIDRELLAEARRAFGPEIGEAARMQLRDGFWTAVKDAAVASDLPD